MKCIKAGLEVKIVTVKKRLVKRTCLFWMAQFTSTVLLSSCQIQTIYHFKDLTRSIYSPLILEICDVSMYFWFQNNMYCNVS